MAGQIKERMIEPSNSDTRANSDTRGDETANVAAVRDVVRGPYLLTGREMLTDEIATKIVQLMRTVPEKSPKGALAGRGYTGVQDLPQVGRVFVKQYAHGGLLRKLTGGRFVCCGPSRSQLEFGMLERVRAIGVNAPKPYICVTKGSFFYQTWLIMEEIKDSKNLVLVSQDDSEALQDCMKAVAEQVLLLIKNNIFHVDLHPGNVLLSGSGAVYIVDFDKARIFNGSGQALRELYLRRWRRAVIKHGLSPVLSELMSLSLRSYND